MHDFHRKILLNGVYKHVLNSKYSCYSSYVCYCLYCVQYSTPCCRRGSQWDCFPFCHMACWVIWLLLWPLWNLRICCSHPVYTRIVGINEINGTKLGLSHLWKSISKKMSTFNWYSCLLHLVSDLDFYFQTRRYIESSAYPSHKSGRQSQNGQRGNYFTLHILFVVLPVSYPMVTEAHHC